MNNSESTPSVTIRLESSTELFDTNFEAFTRKFCQSTLQQGHTGRKDENCTEKQDGSALNNPSNRTNRNRLSVPQRKE
ncbi:unnamed protein product [Allacma fusca]|uniref:Uncharacterized protein n=1 Tax=Allacma fusca TaxID=39272 RepID=A0A8J2JIW9_9HEXA|nr:unnamed protein product [Allacma fusca]